MIKRRFFTWFGILSTLLFFTSALVPAAFGVPTSWRPWVFLGSILWFFLFSTGTFSS